MVIGPMGKPEDFWEVNRPGWGGIVAAVLAIASCVCLIVAVASPRLITASQEGGGATLGLFQLCAKVVTWDDDQQAEKMGWACSYSSNDGCQVPVCTYTRLNNSIIYECTSYDLFYPTGFQNTPIEDPRVLSPNISLANPDLLFPGEGNCGSYRAAKSLMAVAVIFSLAGTICAPFICCWHSRSKQTMLCSLASFVVALVASIASVAIFGTAVFNPETSMYSGSFWTGVAATVLLAATIPFLAISPIKGDYGDEPPYGTPGFPYANPDRAGMYATHEPAPEPPMGTASSAYPQPGNNFARHQGDADQEDSEMQAMGPRGNTSA